MQRDVVVVVDLPRPSDGAILVRRARDDDGGSGLVSQLRKLMGEGVELLRCRSRGFPRGQQLEVVTDDEARNAVLPADFLGLHGDVLDDAHLLTAVFLRAVVEVEELLALLEHLHAAVEGGLLLRGQILDPVFALKGGVGSRGVNIREMRGEAAKHGVLADFNRGEKHGIACADVVGCEGDAEVGLSRAGLAGDGDVLSRYGDELFIEGVDAGLDFLRLLLKSFHDIREGISDGK